MICRAGTDHSHQFFFKLSSAVKQSKDRVNNVGAILFCSLVHLPYDSLGYMITPYFFHRAPSSEWQLELIQYFFVLISQPLPLPSWFLGLLEGSPCAQEAASCCSAQELCERCWHVPGMAGGFSVSELCAVINNTACIFGNRKSSADSNVHLCSNLVSLQNPLYA